jgi:Uncharacterised protein family (UPF0175)
MNRVEIQFLAPGPRADAAAKWYEVGRRVSQEAAAQIAGMSRSEFVSALSRSASFADAGTADEALAGAELLRQP